MENKRTSLFDLKAEIPIDPDMPDYSNHPFFIAKKQWALDFIKKHPIPKRDLGKDQKH